MGIKAILLVLLVVSIWGINFSFIKIGLEELPPILFSALRFSVVAIPAIFFIPFPKGQLRNILGVGIFLGFLKFGLLFIGLDGYISAGISALILQAQVIFTIAISYLLFKERLSKLQVLGMVISILGFSLFLKSTSGNATFVGIIIILLAALSWSFSNIIMKTMKNVNLLQLMVWSCAVPPLPLFALSYMMETHEPVQVISSITMQTWLALAFVSYISTLIAFSIWGYLLRNNTAASVTQFALLIPIVSMVTSYILLGEQLSSIDFIGSSVVITGVSICIFEKNINNIFSKKAKIF
jgi:O-acetylserine/cysteine efflux transporter